MMEKFDSIYADSVNDDIEFDIIFNSEEDGSLIESVDPDKFYNEAGDEKEIVDDIEDEIDDIDEDDDDDDEDHDDEDDDDDNKCNCKCSKNESIKSIGDLDDLLDDDKEMDECGDDYYGDNHDYNDYDHRDVIRYHDRNDKDCHTVDRDINTIDDLDKRMDTYPQETDNKDKQVVHSGETDSDIYPRQKYTDEPRDIHTIDDLDKRMDAYPIREDEEEDGRLIDKVDRDGAPSDEATPEDFYRPEGNYQDNSFETRSELKEAKTLGELEDSLASEFDNTSNMGLDTAESENPASEESFEDGEDIDAVIGESSFEDFIRRYS